MELFLFLSLYIVSDLPTTVAFTGSDVIVAKHANEYIIRLKSLGGIVVARGLHITFVSILGSLLRGFIVHYPNSQ